MARILAYTSPARGHLFPATAVLLRLQDRGHEIAVVGLAAETARMAGLGFDATALAPEVEAVEMDDWQGRGMRDRLRRSVSVFARRAQHEVPDLQAAIERVRPDVVLVDVNAWGAAAAAAAWGGAWATFSPYSLPLSSPDVPPFGPGFPPMAGPVGRARDAVARKVGTGMLERATLPQVNAVRAGLGLPAFRTIDDIYAETPLLLVTTAEPFEYRRRHWPDNVALVGPCEWEPDSTVPPWLTDAGAVVLVTTSSERQDDGTLARAAAAALADEPVTVVITMPAGQEPPAARPPNVRIETFVPHGPLLDRAVAAVTHGGMGATQKALGRGVPACVVPFGRDQLEVAARVVHSGAGTRLSPRRLTPDRLRDAVHRAAACRDGAARVAAGFAAAGGASAAADAIEGRLLGIAPSAAPRPPDAVQTAAPTSRPTT